MGLIDRTCTETVEVITDQHKRCIRPYEHVERSHVWIEDVTNSDGAPRIVIWETSPYKRIDARLIFPELVHEVDRTARAYGWEVGRGHPLVKDIEVCSDENPFLDPDWADKMVSNG